MSDVYEAPVLLDLEDVCINQGEDCITGGFAFGTEM